MDLYERFGDLCRTGSKKQIEEYINQHGANLNHDDGYFLELIAERNDVELFKMMLEHGGDIRLNNFGVVRLIAHQGYMQLLEYVAKNTYIDLSVLMESSACSNYLEVKEYLNKNFSFTYIDGKQQ